MRSHATSSELDLGSWRSNFNTIVGKILSFGREHDQNDQVHVYMHFLLHLISKGNEIYMGSLDFLSRESCGSLNICWILNLEGFLV